MHRIFRIALAVSALIAAGLALRWFLGRDDAGPGLPAPEPEAGSRASRNGHGSPAADSGRTRDELYRAAQRLEIQGRSKMNKQELKQAVEAAETGGSK